MYQVEHTQLAISCVKCIQYWNSGSLVSSEMWKGKNVQILPPCITSENFIEYIPIIFIATWIFAAC